MTSPPHAGPWARFSARFDDVLLRAPLPGDSAPPTADCADVGQLQRALQGLCPPGAPAAPGFATARHTLAPTPAARAGQQAWLTHQLLLLDGTLHMLQLGGVWRQRLHRLAIKLQEGLHGSAAAPGLPWDCGWLNTTAAAQAQAARFIPRRPTLMLAWQLPPSTLAPLQATLQARSAACTQPMRLWVLDAPGVGASATGPSVSQPL